MKKSEFKNLIKESIREVLIEENLLELSNNNTKLKSKSNDIVEKENYEKTEVLGSGKEFIDGLKRKNPELGSVLEQVHNTMENETSSNNKKSHLKEAPIKNDKKPEFMKKNYADIIKKSDEMVKKRGL